jgi:hypothetical protein
MQSDATPLERLEAAGREVEELATEVAVRAKAFGGDVGSGTRIALVRERLRAALDELEDYPESAEEFGRTITDE